MFFLQKWLKQICLLQPSLIWTINFWKAFCCLSFFFSSGVRPEPEIDLDKSRLFDAILRILNFTIRNQSEIRLKTTLTCIIKECSTFLSSDSCPLLCVHGVGCPCQGRDWKFRDILQHFLRSRLDCHRTCCAVLSCEPVLKDPLLTRKAAAKSRVGQFLLGMDTFVDLP